MGAIARLKCVIVCSLKDPAGTNIRERLLEEFPFRMTDDWYDYSPVYSFEDMVIVSSRKDIVFVDGLDEKFTDCSYIFISRHRAESGIPSLTAHFTGNFGKSSFGGRAREIAMYSPHRLKNYMIELNSQRTDLKSHNITLEATHHGPTDLKRSIMFVELGSSEKEWSDMSASRVIARSLISSHRSRKTYNKCAIGIGGTHYPRKLNRLLIDSEIALGPIIPKYALGDFDEEILEQMVAKSDQKVDFAIVDRKGLGTHKGKVLKLLEKSGLEVINE